MVLMRDSSGAQSSEEQQSNSPDRNREARVENGSTSIPTEDGNVKTRSGRISKPPVRFM